MIDVDGGMLAKEWEVYASELAAVPPEGVPGKLAQIAAAHGVSLTGAPPRVYLARDTRPSSPRLRDAVAAGAAAMGAVVTDFGLLTTPQLHYIVRSANAEGGHPPGAPVDTAAAEAAYFANLATAYRDVLGGVPANPSGRGVLRVDAANGVGGLKLGALSAAMTGLVDIVSVNSGVSPAEAALLNDGCGAEHCQKGRTPPLGFTGPAEAGGAGARCASLDGDADRLVYHYWDARGNWRLLDGDKIAALAGMFVQAQLAALGLVVSGEGGGHHGHGAAGGAGSGGSPTTVSVGVVQTAYANGASTAYISGTLGLPVPLAKTGVKYVHHAAAGYDVGVYFEANGHGTVLLSAPFLARLSAMGSLPPAGEAARKRLLGASRLINQAIGDALSDAMFVEAALTLAGLDVQGWDALYTDLPSRQCKLGVASRALLTTTEDETRLLSPTRLQDAIDALVAAVPSGRAFVRPSGTEDVVRVYAEAATQATADELAWQVACAAYELAGGVGAKPVKIQ